jgi:hypothetical protein
VSGQLQRLVVEFRAGELVVRTLYRTKAGLNPGTVARRREVTELTRSGLEEALEGGAEFVGTSGYEVREDTLVACHEGEAAKLTDMRPEGET